MSQVSDDEALMVRVRRDDRGASETHLPHVFRRRTSDAAELNRLHPLCRTPQAAPLVQTLSDPGRSDMIGERLPASIGEPQLAHRSQVTQASHEMEHEPKARRRQPGSGPEPRICLASRLCCAAPKACGYPS